MSNFEFDMNDFKINMEKVLKDMREPTVCFIQDNYTRDLVDGLTEQIFNNEEIEIQLKDYTVLRIVHKALPFGYSFKKKYETDFLKFESDELFTVEFITTDCYKHDHFYKKVNELYIPLIMIKSVKGIYC